MSISGSLPVRTISVWRGRTGPLFAGPTADRDRAGGGEPRVPPGVTHHIIQLTRREARLQPSIEGAGGCHGAVSEQLAHDLVVSGKSPQEVIHCEVPH